MKILLLLLMSWLPDGTLVFPPEPNTVVGRVARRWATRAQGYPAKHTHVGIVLNGRMYHSDWPRTTTTKIPKGTYILPPRKYSAAQVQEMTRYANSQLGRPYRLRGFIRRDGSEGWCSPFVKNVLNQAGHNLSYQDGFTPDNLQRAVR